MVFHVLLAMCGCVCLVSVVVVLGAVWVGHVVDGVWIMCSLLITCFIPSCTVAGSSSRMFCIKSKVHLIVQLQREIYLKSTG